MQQVSIKVIGSRERLSLERVHRKMSNQRVKTRVSQTASYTCFCRACAYAERDERFRGPDSIAIKFIPFLPKTLFVKNRLVRSLVLKKIMPRGIYEYVSARTMLFDEVFGSAIDKAFPQIVILGAGFDTRAWRFARHNNGTRIFELDAPVTQEMKKKILVKKGVAFPEDITFVPINFEEEDIAEVLGRAGYRADLTTLFLCEGVMMYLTRDAIADTLGFIRQNTAAGSCLLFDYVLNSVIRRENKLYGEAAIHNTVFKTGEEWVYGIEEGAIEPFLKQHGFSLTEHYSPVELQKRYLTADDGTMYGRINETHSVALAAVKTKAEKKSPPDINKPILVEKEY